MKTSNGTSHLDQAFLDAQRDRLIALRNELLKTADSTANEELDVQIEAGGEAHDDADSAERMAIQENDEAQFHQLTGRLAQVQRALEKIDDGTYGFSDRSQKPIPRSRLAAVPEATLLLEEEAEQERAARSR